MAETKKKIDQRRGGFYWKKDPKKPYTSVTTILNIISKPALSYWSGKQVYLAMIQDPTLDEKTALSAPNTKSGEARTRGTAVHSIVESYKHTKEYIDTVPEKYRGYVQAFYKWIEDNDIEILEHERTVFSEKYQFAGTLDLLIKIKKSNRVLVIDVKTGKDIYPEAFLQLSAYKQGLEEEDVTVDGIAVLLLKEKGTFKFEEGESNITAFRAAKYLWEWQNPELMEMVAFYNKPKKEVSNV